MLDWHLWELWGELSVDAEQIVIGRIGAANERGRREEMLMPDFRYSVAVAIAMAFSVSATAQQPGSKYHSAKEALDAAQSSHSEQAELAALDELGGIEDLNRDDILALHTSMRNLETRAKGKGDEYAKARVKRMAKALGRCTREKDKATIAEVLGKEADDLPRNLSTPFDDKANESEGVRMSRVAMLIQLSGEAKNQAALPALRRISKKGGVPAELAQQAIGQIGAPEDLDAFVDEIKNNPKSRVNFSGFGPAIVDRIMREVDNPSLPEFNFEVQHLTAEASAMMRRDAKTLQAPDARRPRPAVAVQSSRKISA